MFPSHIIPAVVLTGSLLAFLAGAGAMLIILTLSLLPPMRRQWRYRRLRLRGREATAVILLLEPTGRHRANRPEVRVQVQVMPPRGRRFIAELYETVSYLDLPTLHSGSTVRVKYNPRRHGAIVLAGPVTAAAPAAREECHS